MSPLFASLTGFAGEVSRKFLNWLDLDFWQLLLIFMLMMLTKLLAKAHTATGNDFDIKYLLIDETTNRVSLKKMGALLALLISSWIVLYMTVKTQMTEAILGLYLFVWAGVYVTPQSIAAWRNPPPPPTPATLTGGNNGQPTA